MDVFQSKRLTSEETKHDTAACPCHKKSVMVFLSKHCQKFDVGDLSSLFSNGEAISQERHGHIEESPKEGHEGNFLWRKFFTQRVEILSLRVSVTTKY